MNLLTVLLLVVLLAAVAAEARSRGARRHSGFPRFTVAALVIVGVPSLLQLTVAPQLLGLLQRDAGRISQGEVWRLGTALVVQDGGVPGTVFNLVSLLVVGLVVERRWGAQRAAVIALVGGVAGELWGLVVQPVGAGNSVAVFALAASVAVAAVAQRDLLGRVLGLVSLAAAVALLVMRDIHGGAALAGAVVGVLMLATGAGGRGRSKGSGRSRPRSRRRSRR